jgi:hypothetical protein
MGMDASRGLHKLCRFPHGGQLVEMMAFSQVFQVCQALLRDLTVQKSYKNRWIPLAGCFHVIQGSEKYKKLGLDLSLWF